MNTAFLLDPSLSQQIAAALLHLTWLGAVVGLGAGIANALLQRASPRSRYQLNAVALAVMLLAVPIVLTMQAVTMRAAAPRPAAAESAATESAVAARALPVHAPIGESTAVAEPQQPSAAVLPPQTPFTGDRPVPRTWKATAPWITGIYAIGVLTMLARLTLGLCIGCRLQQSATPLCNPDIMNLIERQARAIGLRVAPVVRYCERVAVPIVVGVVRPMVVLPLSMISALTPEQLTSVLTHELAHIKRLDHIVIVIQRLVESVWFFHPAVWYISRQMDREREYCCDDLVIAAGVPRNSYAGALCHVAELANTRQATAPRAVALAASGRQPSQLRRRIVRLLEGSPQPAVLLTRSGLLGLAILVMGICLPPLLLPAIQQQARAQGRAQPAAQFQPDGDEGPIPPAAPTEDDLLRQDLKRLIGRWQRVVPNSTPPLKEVLTIDGEHDTLEVLSENGEVISRCTSEFKLERAGDVRIYNRSKVELVKGRVLPHLSAAATQSFIVQVGNHRFYEVSGLLQDRNGSRRRPVVALWKEIGAAEAADEEVEVMEIGEEGPVPVEPLDPQADGLGIAARRAKGANDPELKRDLQLLQGSWETVNRDTQGNVIGTNEKLVKGNTEKLTVLDAEGKVTYRHTVKFHLEKYGPLRIFNFYDMTIETGPGAGAVSAEDYAFVYRVDADRFLDGPGVFVSRSSYRDVPILAVWRRPQSRDEVDATIEIETLGGSVSKANRDEEDQTTVRLTGKNFGDEQLRLLHGFKNLRELFLIDSNVTDAGLKDVARLTTLTRLDLAGTAVGDAGLKEVAHLTNLTQLSLKGTRITDAGLAELSAIRNLQQLYLGQTKITDRGVNELVKLKALAQLGLGSTSITDAGLEELSVLESLRTLYIGGPQFTDASVKQLVKFKNLAQLGLGRAKITAAGIQELKKALPDTNIHR